jgi:hypothetical protein
MEAVRLGAQHREAGALWLGKGGSMKDASGQAIANSLVTEAVGGSWHATALAGGLRQRESNAGILKR